MTPAASAASPARPDALPPEAVADVARMLPGWLESVRTLRRLSGIQLAIWHEGSLACDIASGPADEEAGIALRTTHRLRIASHSKMLTAMTIMRLQEQGRLRLDDTLGEHVPQLADSPVADRSLRDLLSHSAGLTRDSSDARWWRLGTPFPDRDALLEIARSDAARQEPGLHLQYSNIGYGLLGLVIEQVTGGDFARAVSELVLDPLDAGCIGPDLPEGAPGAEAPDGFAPGHSSLLHGPRRPVEQIPTGALASATGFWASAGAIAGLAGRVLADGELLEAASVRAMRRRVWSVREGGHYGLGLQEGRLHGFTVLGHSGGFPTGLSRTWAAPAQRLALSVIGTAVDAPSSEIAQGVLGLLALAAGRPAPQASATEEAGAQGGAGDGRPRPAPLAEQPSALGRSAAQLGRALEGSYDSLWGRRRLAVLGGRLLAFDDTSTDPAEGALELSVAGTREDPILPGAQVLALDAWGDTGYGTWAEPVLARMVDGRCTGLIWTGQVQTPSEEFVMPDRVRDPRGAGDRGIGG